MSNKAQILLLLKHKIGDLSQFGVSNIGLFGSYARGEQTKDSDIDILIDFIPEKETFDNYIKVCEFLETLFQGNKIDIVTKNGLSQHIGPQILKEVLYAC